MEKIVIDSFNIVSALGVDAQQHFEKLLNGESGVKMHSDNRIDDQPSWVSLTDPALLASGIPENFSQYEKLLIASLNDVQKKTDVDFSSPKTLFVFSTTKGNISLLEQEPLNDDLLKRLNLFYAAKAVTGYFGNKNEPVVISNACISGVAALLYASRALKSGEFSNVVVTGADTISKFVYSGFKSFQALSPGPCRPFSADRDGINLGEAAATFVLTSTSNGSSKNFISIEGGGTSNDSNHISGPSRTGEELSYIIKNILSQNNIPPDRIDFISAHGTATPYNDEMEARAFHLSGLAETPVHSLKGYFGHTLGAAGLVESAICAMSLLNNTLVASHGYSGKGITPALNVITSAKKKELSTCLKTASGFGGCNAAILFSKN